MLDGKEVDADEKTEANHVKIRKGIPKEKADKGVEELKENLRLGECMLSRIKYLSPREQRLAPKALFENDLCAIS